MNTYKDPETIIRGTYTFEGGILSSASQFRQRVEDKAYRLGVKFETHVVGFWHKFYSMRFAGPREEMILLSKFINELARGSTFRSDDDELWE